MNPNSKKVLAAAAVAGVLVTWIPQLVSAGDDVPKPTTLGPAIEEDDAPPTDPAATREAGGGGSAPVPAPIVDPSDPADTLRIRLDEARAFLPERSSRDLDVLAAAWALDAQGGQATEIPGPPASVPSNTPEAPAVAGAPLATATTRVEAPSVDPLDAFLAANPLTGVLYSADLRVANLGSNVVREGDDLFGLARVESIGPRWIVIEHGARHVRVDLVPLTARPKARADSVDAAGPGVAVAVDSPAPAASPVPSAGGASSASAPPSVDLEKLLLGLQQQLGAVAGTSAKAATTDAKSKDKKP